jgi:ERCC4-type nuclease
MKTPPKIPIQIDTREKRPLDFSAYDDVETSVATIPTGDYGLLGLSGAGAHDLSLCGFERKSLEDLTGSLGRTENRERFLREMQRASCFRFFGIVAECTRDQIELHQYRCLTNPKSIFETIESIRATYGVHFFFCRDAQGAAARVHATFRHIWRHQLTRNKEMEKLLRTGEKEK